MPDVGYVELVVVERLGAAFGVAGDGPEFVQAGGAGPLGSGGAPKAAGISSSVQPTADVALQAHGQGVGVASGVRSTGATPAGPRDWGSEC